MKPKETAADCRGFKKRAIYAKKRAAEASAARKRSRCCSAHRCGARIDMRRDRLEPPVRDEQIKAPLPSHEMCILIKRPHHTHPFSRRAGIARFDKRRAPAATPS